MLGAQVKCEDSENQSRGSTSPSFFQVKPRTELLKSFCHRKRQPLKIARTRSVCRRPAISIWTGNPTGAVASTLTAFGRRCFER